MAGDLRLSLQQARRLAIRSQHLAGPEPAKGIGGMRQVLRGLRVLQMDPVNVVARSHLLVLWSRLGGFDRDDLDALLWRERWLFEHWAHAASIVLTGWTNGRNVERMLDILWKQGVITLVGRTGPNGCGVSRTPTRCTSRSTSGSSAVT